MNGNNIHTDVKADYVNNDMTHMHSANSFATFLIEKGLYDEMDITPDNRDELIELIGGKAKIDVFCTKCGKNRVFCSKSIPCYNYDYQMGLREDSLADSIQSCYIQIKKVNQKPKDVATGKRGWDSFSFQEYTRLMTFQFHCSMDENHHLDYIVLTDENKMKKIGQYPSVADLAYPELKNYRKVLADKDDEKELKRAIGLYANGIGIGAFVYLRRIFERMIAKAGQQAVREGVIEEEVFKRFRMDEKIATLQKYLPELMLDNTLFYKIVSKGIHELNEDECIYFFPIMQDYIMLTLSQWEAKRLEDEKKKKIKSELDRISIKIR